MHVREGQLCVDQGQCTARRAAPIQAALQHDRRLQRCMRHRCGPERLRSLLRERPYTRTQRHPSQLRSVGLTTPVPAAVSWANDTRPSCGQLGSWAQIPRWDRAPLG